MANEQALRPQKAKRWRALVALCITVALSTTAALALRHGGLLTTMNLPTFPSEASALDPLRADPAWELDAFTPAGAPTARLEGAIRAPTEPGTPFVIYFHGNGGGGLGSAYEFATTLDPAGRLGAAAYTHRGYGTSTGRSTIDSMRADAVEMVDRVLARVDVSAEDLVLVGFSIGVISAQEAGATLSQRGTPPRGVVLAATGFRYPFPRRLLQRIAWELELRDQVEAPLLITHGRQDPVIDLANARADFGALDNPRARFLVVDGEHNHLSQLGDALRNFIEDPPP